MKKNLAYWHIVPARPLGRGRPPDEDARLPGPFAQYPSCLQAAESPGKAPDQFSRDFLFSVSVLPFDFVSLTVIFAPTCSPSM